MQNNITPGQEEKREEEEKKRFLQKNNDIYNTRIATSNIKANYNAFTMYLWIKYWEEKEIKKLISLVKGKLICGEILFLHLKFNTEFTIICPYWRKSKGRPGSKSCIVVVSFIHTCKIIGEGW